MTTPLCLPATLPVRRGEHVRLRTLRDDDAAALFAIYGDPLVMRYTDEAPFPAPATVTLMLRSVRDLLRRGESLEWAVVENDADFVIGTCGLHSFDAAQRSAEVGCLLRQASWGQGRMADALDTLARYAHEVLALRTLVADVDPGNLAAQRLFAKLGYTQTRPDTWRRRLPA